MPNKQLGTLHAKFSRLLVRGKARFNFLRAARWRNEAAKHLDDLVEEERRLSPPRAVLDEPVVAVRRNARSVIPKFRKRNKPESPKLIEKPFVKPTKYEATAVEEPAEAAESPTPHVERATRRSFAVRFPRVKVEPTPPPKRSRSDSIMRFKSHGTGGEVGPRVSVAFGRLCRVDGACLVSSRGVVFDELLEGWRFLRPGSCVRCEFRVDDARDLCLELADFVTPDAPPTAVDVSLDGALVTANHTPRGLALFALRNVTTTKRHVLDITLRDDAAPWAYHLEALSVSRKTRRRQPPSRREIERLLASIPPGAGGTTSDTTADEHHRLLLDKYEEGHRNYEREKRRRR